MSDKHDPFVKEGDQIILRSDTETIKGEVAAVKPGNVICVNGDYFSLRAEHWYLIKVTERGGCPCDIVIKHKCGRCGARCNQVKGLWPANTCGLCLTKEEKQKYLDASQPYVLCGACGSKGVVPCSAAGEEPTKTMCLKCDGLGYLLVTVPEPAKEMQDMLSQIEKGAEEIFNNTRRPQEMSLETGAIIEQIRNSVNGGIAECIDSDMITLKKTWNKGKVEKLLRASLPKRGLAQKPIVSFDTPTRGGMVQYLWDRVMHATNAFSALCFTKEAVDKQKLDKVQEGVDFSMERWVEFARTCNGRPAEERMVGTFFFNAILNVAGSDRPVDVRFILDQPEVYENGSDGDDWKVDSSL